MNLALYTSIISVISFTQTGIIQGTEKGTGFVHEKYT